MATFDDPLFSAEEFLGKVRLFPLPNLVLFPHVMQPLHVYERRYRDLLEEALADDRLIAMAVLAPGWEGGYEGCPALYPMACLGRVAAYRRLSDSTYNVLVLGLRRVRLLRELGPSRRFREAEAELCNDVCPAGSPIRQRVLRQKLRKALLCVLPAFPDVQEQLDQLLENDTPLGILADVVGYILDIDPGQKQKLLAEVDVCRRAELLLQHLSAAAEPSSLCFPPQFSCN